jgi:hypothetical protein
VKDQVHAHKNNRQSHSSICFETANKKGKDSGLSGKRHYQNLIWCSCLCVQF